MNVYVNKSKASGKIVIPPSKSDSHRALICASLASGTSKVYNLGNSKDIMATKGALEVLGAKIVKEDGYYLVEGIKDFNKEIDEKVFCNESGSTLRFIIPIFSLTNNKVEFYGAKSLFKRPLSIYEEIFKNQGSKFDLGEDSLKIEGKIKSSNYVIKGDVSSQFISGLLFSLPLLEEDSTIKILPPFESKSYIDMTINTLRKFNIEIKEEENSYYIKGNQHYVARDYIIENDYSQLAFYAVLGAINNDIECLNLNFDSLQGDKKIIDILRSFNVEVLLKEDSLVIKKCLDIKGSYVDLKDCPDLGPIVMVLSLFSSTDVVIDNIKRLRIKESDRVEAMVSNLRLLGADIETFENKMIIHPSKLHAPKEILNPYNDHRIMMSLCVLGSTIGGFKISNHECVNKSYIDFYQDLKNLGIEVSLGD